AATDSAPAGDRTKPPGSGTVGEMIPILEAEAVGEPPAPKSEPAASVPVLPAEPVEEGVLEPPDETPSWQQPPPVRNPKATQKAWSHAAHEGSREAHSTAAPEPDAPARSRVETVLAPVGELPLPVGDETMGDELEPSRRKRKRALITVISMLGLIVLAGIAVVITIFSAIKQKEERLAEQAMRDYEQGTFPIAAQEFRKLVEDYPNKKNSPQYEFFAE